MKSLKSYLIRAVYEWCCDNALTPHLAVYVNKYTQVPQAYVRDNSIVLNIAASAVHKLVLGDETISFSARFGGKSHEIIIPVGHVQGIFARENGIGSAFDVEEYEPSEKSEKSSFRQPENNPQQAEKSFSGLRLIKNNDNNQEDK